MNKVFYQLYHANLAFSAIEEDEVTEVIDKTYFPLLDFIQRTQTKVALELSAYSLEKIQELRPLWIDYFKKVHSAGLIELIGSGYMQIIAPLVPYEINIANQREGIKVYQEILNIVPKIVYVNEQVFSKSLVDLYHDVGYKAIMMEWNNPYSVNIHKWKKEYAYQPVIVKGVNAQLPVLWTDTIVFQQFQRMAHHEILLQEYKELIQSHLDKGYKVLPIYSSDLEIFNYRPGRFETEASILSDEWGSILAATQELKQLGEFLLPSEILSLYLNDAIKLNFVTSSSPIIVKKQEKYSLSRWAACGRGSNYINTLCYNYFLQNGIDKKLLQYWGSDYRTHTTIQKYDDALGYLKERSVIPTLKYPELKNDMEIIEKDNKLIFFKNYLKLVFNKNKGLTLDSIELKNNKINIGTVRHGELEHIANGADFYTGTTTIESAQTRKITDLYPVKDYRFRRVAEDKYCLSCQIKLKDIALEEKSWIIDTKIFTVTLNVHLKLKEFIRGSIRLGTLTLLPQEQNKDFWYECKNGGEEYERFYIDKTLNISQQQVKSLLQSSTGGLGVTDNIIRFGVNEKLICTVEIDKSISYPFVMLQNRWDCNKALTRLFFSVQELDDTLKVHKQREYTLSYTLSLDSYY